MKIIFEDFYSFPMNERSQVFQVFPDVFNDERGYFAEVMKTRFDKKDIPGWFQNQNWIKQINRSKSSGGTVRGCHAQRGEFCQGKLVQALTQPIYDVITDARPDSRTFGTSQVFLLDPIAQNQLWVPRGFLHALAVPSGCNEAIFEYFCDNVYDKKSEFGCNPETVLPKVAEALKDMPDMNEKFAGFIDLFESENSRLLSQKDQNGLDYEKWMDSVQTDYQAFGHVWYR